MTEESTTEGDGVTVRKAFDADSFPVPAITFEIESTRSDAVELALVDAIPESFPMDHVGFHPDYDSDRWTAYQDHRVQYERTLDPGETVTTVYGVRIDDPDEASAFLEEPTVDVRALGEPADPAPTGVEAATTDVVPSDSTDVVREAIAENRTTVPGLDDAADGSDAADDSDEQSESDGPSLPKYDPIGADADLDTDEVTDADQSTDDDDDAAESPVEPIPDSDGPLEADSPDPVADAAPGDDEAVGQDDETTDEDDEPADEDAASQPVDADSDVDGGDDSEPDAGREEGATLEEDDEAMPAPVGDDVDDATDGDERTPTADEAEADDDATEVAPGGALVEALAAEIRAGDVPPTDLAVVAEALGAVSPSTETRIDHLQVRVSDLEAYADALEAFIDENGSAQRVLDELDDGLADVSARTDELATDLAAADRDRDALRDDLDDLSDAVEALDDLQDDLDELGDEFADVETRLAEVAEETEDLADLREDVAGLRDDLVDVDDDVEALQEWREQLTSVLSG